MSDKIILSKMERPILMSPMMVQAIMDGRKIMTRRVLKGLPDEPDAYSFTRMVINPEVADSDDDGDIIPKVLIGTCAEFSQGEWIIKCPFGNVGDILWVKERTWWEKGVDFTNVAFSDGTMITMKAGQPNKTIKIPNWKPTDKKIWKSRPSMFFPKNLCRSRLRITNIRAERLHDISETDAIKEGVEPMHGMAGTFYRDYSRSNTNAFNTAKKSFESLWESINEGAWADNPFVWVIDFKKINQPIT